MRSQTNPYFETRLVAERDRRLSAQAFRLLCCICSHRAGRYLDEDFPLPWSTVGSWIDLAKDQAYAAIRQLIDAGYLKKGELKRCPAERFYFLLTSSRENPPTGSRENSATGSRVNPPASRREKSAPHTSIPSGKEVRERIEGRGKDASALRAESGGRKASAVPAGNEPDGTELRRIDWDALKREALA
jgi:hypothetical protein